MIKKSALFDSLWRNPLHEEEIRLEIAGINYSHKDIVADSVNISGGEFSEPDIGNCASRQIDMTVIPIGVIPRQAEIKVFLRLKLEDQVSEWIPQGVFFISKRSKNKIDGTLSIHGFDAMLKAGQVWLTDDYRLDKWPKTEDEAVKDIASRMGIDIDPRTSLFNEFMVDYPVNENGEMTMTDILEGIAVANSGNWIISNAGKLLLRRYGDIPEETNYLVTEYGDSITIGGVRIRVR